MATLNINERLELTPETQAALEKVNTFEFDIFDFMEICNHDELYIIASFLMNKHNLFENQKIYPEVFFNFIKRV